MSDEFDYVIVGAGSAGCVLASRLTEDPDTRVLVLEAGPPDRSIAIHMPAAFAAPLANDRYNWFYRTEPEPHLDGRTMYCPRGRVLGGSSSINGMAWVRGHALDYERWAAQGLPEWSYAHCLPYFRRTETRGRGGDTYRGDSGPLKVSTGPCRNPLFAAFVEAGVQAGYERTPDMNGYRQEGFGAMDMSVWRGRRQSAAVAWLRPAMRRPNLRVLDRALALRVRFEGTRATGVDYARAGRTESVRAAREVILCGGAINSPQILMLSGVGPADHLRAHGIDPIADLPGVGANLRDHLEIYVQHECTQPISLYPALRPARRLRIGIEWLLAHTGDGASSHFEAGGFVRSRAGVRHPDLQYHFLPIAIRYDGTTPAAGHGFQAHVGPMRSPSRGRVRLRSGDAREPPSILFDYFSAPEDREEMRAAVRLTREVFAQPAFDPFRGAEIAPGPEVRTDAEIDAFVRANAESAYHPSCTCAMGVDAEAVVDPELRVRGVDALRVVDASVMPSIPSGNLNAPTLMIAEKAADIVRGREPLAPVDAPWWEHPRWETRQR